MLKVDQIYLPELEKVLKKIKTNCCQINTPDSIPTESKKKK